MLFLKIKNLKNKNFLCGFCTFEKDEIKQKLLQSQREEILKLKTLINEKIEDVKTYLTNKLDDLKIDLKPTPPTDSTPTSNQLQKPYKTDRYLNLVMFGCKEEEENNVKDRFDKMNQTVKTNLDQVGVTMERSICDFYRPGKRTPSKNRPIILRATNVWEKRKIPAEFRAKQSRQKLSFTIREDYPPNHELKKLKEEARKLNQELKMEAEKNNTVITKSYSARESGIIAFTLKNGKWQKE